jgi:hypothetical protein
VNNPGHAKGRKEASEEDNRQNPRGRQKEPVLTPNFMFKENQFNVHMTLKTNKNKNLLQ